MSDMPTKRTIAQWWVDRDGRIPVEHDEPACFACEYSRDSWTWETSALERCHLVPRQFGGSDEPANLVLLCPACHRAAPDTPDRESMLRWVRDRDGYVVETLRALAAEFAAAGIGDAELAGVDVVEVLRANADKLGIHNGIKVSTVVAVIAQALREHVP